VVELTAEVEKKTTIEEVNGAFKKNLQIHALIRLNG